MQSLNPVVLSPSFPYTTAQRSCYAIISCIIISMITLVFIELFQCTPVSYAWEGWKADFKSGHCLNLDMITYVYSAIKIAQDVIILSYLYHG